MSKVEGDPGLIMRFKVFRRSLKVAGFKNISTPGTSGLQGSKGLTTCREISLVYPKGINGTIFSLSVLDYAKRYYTGT